MGLGLRIRGVGLHPKGPKYLYKVWFLVSRGISLLVWVSIPHMGT